MCACDDSVDWTGSAVGVLDVWSRLKHYRVILCLLFEGAFTCNSRMQIIALQGCNTYGGLFAMDAASGAEVTYRTGMSTLRLVCLMLFTYGQQAVMSETTAGYAGSGCFTCNELLALSEPYIRYLDSSFEHACD